jgi:phosphate transport system substrate-binding protein
LQLLRITTAMGLLAATATASAIAADVPGAGATFPYPIYAKWADACKKETGITVNYQSVGSGEGIKQIQNKEVIFGASDMPLAGGDLDTRGLVQFPTVIGGVVAVVNVASKRATSHSTARHWPRSSSARSSHGMTPRFESSIQA